MHQRAMSTLPSEMQQLVDLMAEVGFGQIEQVVVRGGIPQLQPMPRVVREIKFGEREAAPARKSADTCPKRHVVELIAALAEIGDGIIERLEIRHGLPFRMVIAETGAERRALP
jgi:hypothetical protein